MNRDFKGIWIPKEIWLHPTISIQAKALWAEIFSLHDPERGGCFASNEYLCKFLGIKLSRLKEVLKELRDAQFLRDISFNGRYRVICAIYPLIDYGDQQPAGKPAGSQPENRPADSRDSGFSHIYSNKPSKKKSPASTPSAEASEVSSYLIHKLKEVNPKFKEPNTEKWMSEVDTMLRLDGHKAEECKRLIDWAFSHKDVFWNTIFQSPSSLRKHFSRGWQVMLGEKSKGIGKEDAQHKLITENRDWIQQKLHRMRWRDDIGKIEIQERGAVIRTGDEHLPVLYSDANFKEIITNKMRSWGYTIY